MTNYCCRCGNPNASHPMILERNNFGKYPKGNYYCCSKCHREWEILFKKNKKELKPFERFQEFWLDIFFLKFLPFNPSQRIKAEDDINESKN